ncbi:MAG TPA: hypothetical protein VFY16_06010 [Gemmatimonadaceae bacterium]|jgi:hypothetical protein|nr:hypothetical protein [Gemmatimonadaceae bacterium]
MTRRPPWLRVFIALVALAQLVALPASAVFDGQLVARDAVQQSIATTVGVAGADLPPAHPQNCAFCEIMGSARTPMPAPPAIVVPVSQARDAATVPAPPPAIASRAASRSRAPPAIHT